MYKLILAHITCLWHITPIKGTMMKNPIIAGLILYVMTLGQLGTDIYLPSFTAIQHALNTSSGQVQLTVSLFFLGVGISQLFYGPLADSFGRKPFLLFGICTYLVTSLIAATTSSIDVLLIARLLQGIGAGACSVIPRAIMRDCFTGKTLAKVTIYQALTWSLVPILAPVLGSYIQHYAGWRYNFYVLAGAAAIGLLFSLIYNETLPYKNKPLHLKQVFSDYKDILTNKIFIGNLVFCIAYVVLLNTFNVVAPYLLQVTLHYSVIQYGWIIFSIAMFFTMGAMVNTILIKYFDSRTLLNAGIMLLSLASLLLVLAFLLLPTTLWSIVIPLALFQLAGALFFPAAMGSILQIFPQKAGMAAAVIGFSLFSSTSLATAVITKCSMHSIAPLVIFFIVMSSACIFSHLYLSTKQRSLYAS
jgi:Bcr/CflA subfamily drug resistance transporter